MKFSVLIACLSLALMCQAQKIVKTDSGLEVHIHEKGKGKTVPSGATVEVHYTGYLTDSTKFDSSLERDTPFKFVVGSGQVIKGWDEGLQLLKEGSEATLIIPAELGYGERGAGNGQIPPNATLIFNIQVVSVALPPKPPKPFKVKKKDTTFLESGLGYILVCENKEGEPVDSGNVVSVHYSGYLEDGSMFDSSVARGEPFNFPIGYGKVIKGWDQGITQLRVGEKARLVIPSELGYGIIGYPPIIPANATLIFDVEVLEIVSQ